MKSIDHRREAERHASKSAYTNHHGHPLDPAATDFHLRLAQVHATLARNEEDAANRADMRDANTKLRRDLAAMLRLIVEHVANALTSNDLYAWVAVRDLARDLDIDNAVDERLAELDIDPKWAWKHPSSRIDRDGKTWIDLGGQRHDLTKAYADEDGKRWKWTGRVDDRDGHPIFASEQTSYEASLDALTVFGAKPEDGAR